MASVHRMCLKHSETGYMMYMRVYGNFNQWNSGYCYRKPPVELGGGRRCKDLGTNVSLAPPLVDQHGGAANPPWASGETTSGT